MACIDFSFGDEIYKTKWMSSRCERRGIIFFNRRSHWEALLGAMKQGRTGVRKTLHQIAAQ